MFTFLMFAINSAITPDIFQQRALLKRKSKADGSPLPDFRQVKTKYGVTLSFSDFYRAWIPGLVVAVTIDGVIAISLDLPALRGWEPVVYAAVGVELVAVLTSQIYGAVRKSRARRKDLTPH
jgi:hypothetical protein